VISDLSEGVNGNFWSSFMVHVSSSCFIFCWWSPYTWQGFLCVNSLFLLAHVKEESPKKFIIKKLPEGSNEDFAVRWSGCTVLPGVSCIFLSLYSSARFLTETSFMLLIEFFTTLLSEFWSQTGEENWGSQCLKCKMT
jgi:hypothetical protein